MLVPIFGLFFCVMLVMILMGDLPLDEVDIELLIALGAVGVIGAVLITEAQERFKPKETESFEPQPAWYRRRRFQWATGLALSLVLGVSLLAYLGSPKPHEENTADQASPELPGSPVADGPRPPSLPQASLAGLTSSGASVTQASAAVPADSAAMQNRIEATLQAWAAAWEAGDIERYLAYYSVSFKPERGITRQAWSDTRRQRVTSARGIRLALMDVRITLSSPDKAQAVFVQDYTALNLKDRSRKTLMLERTGSGWKILSESSVPMTAGVAITR
jgi:ketosteroid isomerase-like protein